jgi:hypothetical protein
MSKSLEFGVLLHTRHLIRDAGVPPSFDELWEDAVQVEEMGFDHVWLGDSVTILDKARGDCLTTIAALALCGTPALPDRVIVLPTRKGDFPSLPVQSTKFSKGSAALS